MSTNDYWTLDIEQLGMQETGEELARLLLGCRPPYAISVQGKWGSGKTSLMRYAMARLGGKPIGTSLSTAARDQPTLELPTWLRKRWDELADGGRKFVADEWRNKLEIKGKAATNLREILANEPCVIPIWFNPWQHEGNEAPVVSLLQEMRAQFTFLTRLHAEALKLGQISVESGLNLLGGLIDAFSKLKLGVPGNAGKAIASVRPLGEAYEKKNFETVPDAQRFNLIFEEAVRRLLGDTEKEPKAFPDRKGVPFPVRRLIVFIDDLDRCSEIQAVRLLEAIKLYLQTEYCVFVFGLDGSAVRRAVRNQLTSGNREEAQEYLEKLFQAVVQVPVHADYLPFIESLLETTGLENEAKKTDDAGADQPRSSIATLLIRLLEPNPRKIKNFLNSLSFVCQPTGGCSRPIEHQILFHYLRIYHPDVYRVLSYDPRTISNLHRMLNEGTAQPIYENPIDLFLARQFRHVQPLPPEPELSRDHEDKVVDEVLARLDRHKSDAEFVKAWKDAFGGESKETLIPLLSPCLVTSSSQDPGEGSQDES